MKLTALPFASVILMALLFLTGRTKLLEGVAGFGTGVPDGIGADCAGVCG